MLKLFPRKGNILDAKDIDVIVHGCNCSGGFGSGIAGQIAKRYPEVKNAYNTSTMRLGSIQSVILKNNQIIVNAFTQESYGPVDQGPYVSYVALRNCVKEVFRQFPEKHIGFPKIGAGLGGGNWDIICRIIQEEAAVTKTKISFFYL